MPKKYSLVYKKDFDNLFKKGHRLHSQHFTLVCDTAPSLKVAFVAPKKHIKKATDRNYAKRITREITRKQLTALLTRTPTYHLAVMIKVNLRDLVQKNGFEAVQNELTGLLSRLRKP